MFEAISGNIHKKTKRKLSKKKKKKFNGFFSSAVAKYYNVYFCQLHILNLRFSHLPSYVNLCISRIYAAIYYSFSLCIFVLCFV